MKKNQAGFGAIGFIAIFIVIAVIGLATWRVLAHKSEDKKAPVANTTTTQQTAAETPKKEVKWLTYKNEEAGITFRYPEDWVHKAERIESYGSFGGVSGTLTAPSGSKMTWVFQIIGGKGGGCEAAETDVPFAAGNKCSSKQIISVEKAQSIKPPTGKDYRNIFEDSLYITRTKHLSMWGDGKTTYQICLDPYYTSETNTHSDETPKPSTFMGLYFPCAYWDTGFNAKFEVPNEAGFNSADAKTAEAIMKTFDSL
ncbi:MAG TPA: PsbP-related protein [Ktedonobacteraceae bacterium]|nr:PsbP-related protein [Ktedonobacteraceae bacterium]